MRVIFRCDPALVDLIPKPVPARQALPDWLRSMPRHAFSDVHGEDVRTVKQCPPFVDAMAQGFVIPLPCDVTVRGGPAELGLGHPGTRRRAPSARADQLPCARPGRGNALCHTRIRSSSNSTVSGRSSWSRAGPCSRRIPSIAPICPFVCSVASSTPTASMMSAFCFPAVWLDAGFLGHAAARHADRAMHSRSAAGDDLRITAPSILRTRRRYDETATLLLSGPGVYRRAFRAPRSGAGAARARPAEVSGTQP